MSRLLSIVAVAALTFVGAAGPSASSASAAASAAGSAASASAAWRPRPPEYAGVTATRDVPIPMSDGVRLFADVYRPARADGTVVGRRLPVLVVLTAYNKSTPMTAPDYLVRRGYVMVQVDVRGTGSSEGTWSAFGKREQRDGAEVVEWAHARARPWSDGRIGMLGPSYLGIGQLFTAARHPAGLKAIFPTVPSGDVYRDVVASGGQLDLGFIPLWLGLVTVTGVIPPAYAATDPAGALGALLSHVAGAARFQGPLLTDAIAGGDSAYDGAFYRTRSPLSVIDRVDVPTFIVGGEYDLFQRGEPMLFDALQAGGVPTKLVFGPWNHLQASLAPSLAGTGLRSLDALQLRWFDRWVKGRPDPSLNRDIAPITYYEQGSDRWRTARHWLDDDIAARSWRLSGTARPAAPGQLTRGDATGGADAVLPIPVAGLCTRSASQWTAGVLSGMGPLTNPCDSDNRLNDLAGTSYETAPLRRPVDLLGPINARLYVSTTTHDGMLSVHVEDVAPDGTATRLTGGWQVISLRALDRDRTVRRDGEILQPYHPFTRASKRPVQPGRVVRVDVEVFPTGARLGVGHRLRMTIQAFDVPHLAPTLPDALNTLGVITVHHSARYPSRVTLPVRQH
ncbi:MAG TPA: CocE/NonD family hydrolase [Nocardioidaceae bacterium]|nr:CocE/NonD family hydrolase [Nocardioidaceae bacterium]